MTADYTIEPDKCSLCEAERDGRFWEDADKEFPNTATVQPPNETWQEFRNDWDADHPPVEKMCFVFVADCQGDAISLCHECLSKITKRVWDQDSAMPGSRTRWYAHEKSDF